jgi:hypothetical protein
MKAIKALLMVVILVIPVLPKTSSCQVPYVAVYFDPNLEFMAADCPMAPPGYIADTVYVAGSNFDMLISSVEYQISYPPELMFLGDILYPNSTGTGNSADGIAIDFTTPTSSYSTVVFQAVYVLWMCGSCVSTTAAPVRVDPHPSSGQVRAIR